MVNKSMSSGSLIFSVLVVCSIVGVLGFKESLVASMVMKHFYLNVNLRLFRLKHFSIT